MNLKRINAAIEKTAAGDEKAFERLYIETRGGVYSFVYTYFHNSFDAEDVMQTVFLKIKTNADKFTPGTNGLAWILQIAKNLSLKELAKRKTQANYIEKIQSVRADYAEDSDLSIMELMNSVLSEEEQRIITLHVIWGYKHREIAEILNCPIGTVTSKYKRAAEKIKKQWEVIK